MPVSGILQTLKPWLPQGQDLTGLKKDLQRLAMDADLRASGRGRTPETMTPEMVTKVLESPAEELPEMFPVGWESVTASGRVDAVRAARIRAYQAMAETIRAIPLGPTGRVGDMGGGVPAADARFDIFIRTLPASPARLMPDGVAEVQVTAGVRDLIRALKEIRALEPASRVTDEQIDQISIRLKADNLTVTGYGMPRQTDAASSENVSPSDSVPLPDWAATVLEARALSHFPEDATDPEEARILASRSAKALALADLERQLDAVRLDDGRTVRERAAKDDVFLQDSKTFLASAKVARSDPTPDGKGWEATLRLPLGRLYEFSRPRQ
jgi:hypothetical protein